MGKKVQEAKKGLLFLIIALVVIGLIISFCMGLIALLGSLKLTDGCLMRYSPTGDNSSQQVSKTLVIKATGNYNTIAALNSNGSFQTDNNGNYIYNPDPTGYGQWVGSNLNVSAGQGLNFNINGTVSMCRAYIPQNNLESTGNTDQNGNLIPIPRVEEAGNPVILLFSATTQAWRNLAELYPNDHVQVYLNPEQTMQVDSYGNVLKDVTNISFTSLLTGATSTVNCNENNTTYSPICGRYTILNEQYISGCTTLVTPTQTDWDCTGSGSYTLSGDTSGGCGPRNSQYGYYENINRYGPSYSVSDTCYYSCWTGGGIRQDWSAHIDNITTYPPAYSQGPLPYKNDGTRTFPTSTTLSTLIPNYNNVTCSSNNQGATQTPYWWYSATSATGLLYRFDTNLTPTNANNLGSQGSMTGNLLDPGSGYAWATQPVTSLVNIPQLMDYNNTTTYTTYLQFSMLPLSMIPNASSASGGYMIGVKQTKCVGINGQGGSAPNDTYSGRGQVQFIIAPTGENPNTSGNSYNIITPTFDSQGNASITVPSNAGGTLWALVNNATVDYPNSYGQYNLKISTATSNQSFTALVLTPLFSGLKTRILAASETMFQNMTCYSGSQTSTCINFFNYIKALLTLYVMIYGMMFLMGMVKINQTDLIIRIMKIAIVAGLLDGKTYIFFSTYVFNFVQGFSDEIISNMSGYSLFTSTDSIQNPFMFFDSVMSKIFFNQTFFAQIIALFALGLSGILYFLLVFVALMVFAIAALKAISVYLMALLAQALLLGLVPIFLTFMLFSVTRPLFDKWIKFLVRCMLEPVILMAGIIILTQLFTIYLDYATGYSVCWKCAIAFKLPLAGIIPIPGFSNTALAQTPLFCFYWFAPWGIDNSSGVVGPDMTYFISLGLIAFAAYKYGDFASQITKAITGVDVGLDKAGAAMSASFESQVKDAFKGDSNVGKKPEEGDDKDEHKDKEHDPKEHHNDEASRKNAVNNNSNNSEHSENRSNQNHVNHGAGSGGGGSSSSQGGHAPSVPKGKK